MISYGAGSRFHELIGATMLSLYDWYADLPPASPQVFGDQTDVPESGDWYNSQYLIMWGSNIPLTRTPDAHFMAEARYHGQKVIVVSPDFADNTSLRTTGCASSPARTVPWRRPWVTSSSRNSTSASASPCSSIT